MAFLGLLFTCYYLVLIPACIFAYFYDRAQARKRKEEIKKELELLKRKPLELEGKIRCNPPNEYFNQYNATIELEEQQNNEKTVKEIPVNATNLLICGAIVKDTEELGW